MPLVLPSPLAAGGLHLSWIAEMIASVRLARNCGLYSPSYWRGAFWTGNENPHCTRERPETRNVPDVSSRVTTSATILSPPPLWTPWHTRSTTCAHKHMITSNPTSALLQHNFAVANVDESLVAIVPSQNGSAGMAYTGSRLIIFPCRHSVQVTKFHDIVERFSKQLLPRFSCENTLSEGALEAGIARYLSHQGNVWELDLIVTPPLRDIVDPPIDVDPADCSIQKTVNLRT
ncbi:hypothetical protein EMCRGX_G022516 [Ephydatia muelleri]